MGDGGRKKRRKKEGYGEDRVSRKQKEEDEKESEEGKELVEKN